MRSFVEELAAVLSDGTKREKLRLPSDNPLGRAGLSLKLPRLGVDRCLHGTIARGSPVFPPHEGEPVAEKVLGSKVPSLSPFWGVWAFCPVPPTWVFALLRIAPQEALGAGWPWPCPCWPCPCRGPAEVRSPACVWRCASSPLWLW